MHTCRTTDVHFHILPKSGIYMKCHTICLDHLDICIENETSSRKETKYYNKFLKKVMPWPVLSLFKRAHVLTPAQSTPLFVIILLIKQCLKPCRMILRLLSFLFRSQWNIQAVRDAISFILSVIRQLLTIRMQNFNVNSDVYNIHGMSICISTDWYGSEENVEQRSLKPSGMNVMVRHQ